MANDLVGAANDLRKMRRSMRLREETDPEVVANTLETLLKENVAMRSLDSGALGKKAAREVADMRNALIAKQVNAGTRQTDLIGKFSAVTEQFEEIDMQEKKSRSETGVVGQGISTLKDSIPSADALASAMMTANPLLGYAFRTLNNIRKSRSESKKRSDLEAKKRLAVLQKQQGVIQEQLGNEQKSEKAIEESQSVVNDMSRIENNSDNSVLQESPTSNSSTVVEGNRYTTADNASTAPESTQSSGVYADSLKAIETEIKELNKFLKMGSENTDKEMAEMTERLEQSKVNSQESIRKLDKETGSNVLSFPASNTNNNLLERNNTQNSVDNRSPVSNVYSISKGTNSTDSKETNTATNNNNVSSIFEKRTDEQTNLLEKSETKTDVSNDRLEKISESSEKAESQNTEIISSIQNDSESVNNKLQKIIDIDTSRMRTERDNKSSESLLQREKDFKLQNKKPSSPLTGAGKKGGGLPILGMLGGLLGAGAGILGGAMAGIAGFAKKILGPFVGLLSFLKKGGSLLGRFARFGVVTTALFAIYDFFDGFFSASRILQKSANSIDWKDRAKTGFASIVSGILSPIDWMAEKLGVEGGIFKGSRDDFTRKVVGFYDSVFEAVEEIFDSVLKVFDKVKGFVSDQVLSKLPNWMTDWASSKDENGNDKPKTQTQTGWFSLENWWKKDESNVENSKSTAVNAEATSSEPDNKPKLDDPGPYSKRMLEESTNRANKAMNNTSKKIANDGTSNTVNNSSSGNNTVVAPSSNQTINTSNSFSRVADSHNNEPTHRRFLGGFLSLNY